MTSARYSKAEALERWEDPVLFAAPECPLCGGSGLYDDLTCLVPMECCGLAICLCVWDATGPRYPASPEVDG